MKLQEHKGQRKKKQKRSIKLRVATNERQAVVVGGIIFSKSVHPHTKKQREK